MELKATLKCDEAIHWHKLDVSLKTPWAQWEETTASWTVSLKEGDKTLDKSLVWDGTDARQNPCFSQMEIQAREASFDVNVTKGLVYT